MSQRIVLPVSVVLLVALAVVAVASARPAATPDVRLLAQYEPVLQLDPLEQFQPTRVESFVTDSTLEPTGVHPAIGNLPTSGTWHLDEDACTPSAPVGGLACYAAAGAQGGGGPVAYGHVVREDDQIVLQYWFFYYDDVYSYAYPPTDFIWQAHEGDWESVSVVLSAGEEPLYVGYSQHCSGQRRAWAGTPRFDDTHPVVDVAIGSHANYFTPGTHPINVACIPPQAVAILQRNGLPLPVDFAFPGGAVVGPPRSGGSVMPIDQIGDDGPSWVQFPGFWGEAQFFHAPAPIGTVPFGTSPVGPAFHPEWSDPLGTLATWPAS